MTKSEARLTEYRAFFKKVGLYKEMALTQRDRPVVLMDVIYQRKDYLAARASINAS